MVGFSVDTKEVGEGDEGDEGTKERREQARISRGFSSAGIRGGRDDKSRESLMRKSETSVGGGEEGRARRVRGRIRGLGMRKESV